MTRPRARAFEPEEVAPRGEGIDLEALLCALVLAPLTFSRNKFFSLFTLPRYRKVRSRAAQLRTMIRHLAGRDLLKGALVDEVLSADGSTTLRYRVPQLNLERTALLDPLEASLVRFALHRAGDGSANAPALPNTDRSRVEQALGKLHRAIVPLLRDPGEEPAH